MSDITDFKYAIVSMFRELKETLLGDIKEVVITAPYETDIPERKNKEENVSEKKADRKIHGNSVTEKNSNYLKKSVEGIKSSLV